MMHLVSQCMCVLCCMCVSLRAFRLVCVTVYVSLSWWHTLLVSYSLSCVPVSCCVPTVLAVVFTRTVSSMTNIKVWAIDTISCATVNDLVDLMYNRALAQAETVPRTVNQLPHMMNQLSGLRGITILYVFYYHWHPYWPGWLQCVFFNRPIDMQIFFLLIGMSTFIQNKGKSFYSPTSVLWFWWQQFKRLFPVFYLGVFLCFALPEKRGVLTAVLWSQRHQSTALLLV